MITVIATAAPILFALTSRLTGCIGVFKCDAVIMLDANVITSLKEVFIAEYTKHIRANILGVFYHCAQKYLLSINNKKQYHG